MAGTASLTKYSFDLENSFFHLDAIEEQVVLLRILAHKEDSLHVGIGKENDSDALSETCGFHQLCGRRPANRGTAWHYWTDPHGLPGEHVLGLCGGEVPIRYFGD